MSNLYIETISDFINSEGVIGDYPGNIDLAVAITVLEYRMKQYAIVKEIFKAGVLEKWLEKRKLTLLKISELYGDESKYICRETFKEYGDGCFPERIGDIVGARNAVIHSFIDEDKRVMVPDEEKKRYIQTIKDFCRTFPMARVEANISGGPSTACFDVDKEP